MVDVITCLICEQEQDQGHGGCKNLSECEQEEDQGHGGCNNLSAM